MFVVSEKFINRKFNGKKKRKSRLPTNTLENVRLSRASLDSFGYDCQHAWFECVILVKKHDNVRRRSDNAREKCHNFHGE